MSNGYGFGYKDWLKAVQKLIAIDPYDCLGVPWLQIWQMGSTPEQAVKAWKEVIDEAKATNPFQKEV